MALALDAQGIDQFDAVSEVRRVSTFKSYSAHSGVAIKTTAVCVFSRGWVSQHVCASASVQGDGDSLYR